MKAVKKYLLVAVAALSLVFMPTAANAQYVQLLCDNQGGVSAGQLYYADQTNQTGACQNQNGQLVNHIFSQVVCDFVVILNNVVGKMYCGIQYSLTPTLKILLIVYVIVFGIQVLMGMAQLNSKEMIVRLLKIAGVWVFATESTWGLTLIFQFFFGAAAEGSMWVINSISPPALNANPTSFTACQAIGKIAIQQYPGNFDFMPIYSFLDCIIYRAIAGPFTELNNTLIGFFLVLIFFFAPLFSMAVAWVLTTLVMLVRMLVRFLMCLSIIAFLIAISSIFLSFLLFQSTRNLFEDWLKYLISYTLQIVIIFAIIALWIATMSIFGGFFNELSAMIKPNQNVKVGATAFDPDDTFGICEYKQPMSYSPPGQAGQPCVAGQPCLPALVCDGSNTVFSPSQLQKHEDFIYFMTYNLIVLLIIAYAFNVLVNEAPKIAVQLSGPANIPPLGGGFGMRNFGQIAGGGGGRSPKIRVAPSVEERDDAENPAKNYRANAAKMQAGRGGRTAQGQAQPPAAQPPASPAWTTDDYAARVRRQAKTEPGSEK